MGSSVFRILNCEYRDGIVFYFISHRRPLPTSLLGVTSRRSLFMPRIQRGFNHFCPNRRDLLRSGIVGILGLSLPELLSATSNSTKVPKGKAKNVLVVLEQGGLSHIDTWDPKPEAVADHRSPFKPISTKVPGIQLTELLTNTARVTDK